MSEAYNRSMTVDEIFRCAQRTHRAVAPEVQQSTEQVLSVGRSGATTRECQIHVLWSCMSTEEVLTLYRATSSLLVILSCRSTQPHSQENSPSYSWIHKAFQGEIF